MIVLSLAEAQDEEVIYEDDIPIAPVGVQIIIYICVIGFPLCCCCCCCYVCYRFCCKKSDQGTIHNKPSERHETANIPLNPSSQLQHGPQSTPVPAMQQNPSTAQKQSYNPPYAPQQQCITPTAPQQSYILPAEPHQSYIPPDAQKQSYMPPAAPYQPYIPNSLPDYSHNQSSNQNFGQGLATYSAEQSTYPSVQGPHNHGDTSVPGTYQTVQPTTITSSDSPSTNHQDPLQQPAYTKISLY